MQRLGLFVVGGGAAVMALLAGCGARTDFAELDPVVVVPTSDAGVDVKPPKDATPDGNTYVPKGKRCVRNPNETLPVRFEIPPNAPKPAFPRPPQLQYFGGPLLKRPTIVPITFNGDEYRNEIEDFVASVGCTDYWHAVMNDYGVGEAVTGTPIHLSETAPTKITNNQIASWLRQKIETKAVPDDQDVLYAIYYPETTLVLLDGERSCETFGAYHYEVALGDGTKRAYSVMPRCQGFGGLSDLDELTGSSSHEFVEAATDPFPISEPGHPQPEADGIAWAIAAGGENADLCTFDQEAFFQPTGYAFTVQRAWSNSAAFKGLDPCAPQPGGTYFGGALILQDKVTIDLGDGPVQATGLSMAVGSTKSVQVRIFGGPGAVTLSAHDLGQALNEPKTVDLSLSKSSGVDGDFVTLTVKRNGKTSFGPTPIMIRANQQGREKHWFGLIGD